MKDVPLVSIITPSFNQGKFIEDTLLSVKNQNYPNIEHIILDGGSTDNTIEILKKYEVGYNLRWISEPDGGQSDAVNKGFRMTKGKIIGWINSDDVYFYKDTISYVVEQFIKNPSVDIIYGNDALIDEYSNIFYVRIFHEWDYKKLLRGFSIPQPATFFRKEVIVENLLDKNLELNMDFEFWLRLGKKYRFKHVKKVLAGNRLHKKRKRISREEEAREEDKIVLNKYGQKFDLKYYLLHYLDLLDRITLKKFVGVIEILTVDFENLAFKSKFRNKISLLFCQIFPKLCHFF